MLRLVRAGVEEGVWLRAERQVAGRGRQGRAWESPAGNFYASTPVRLRPADPAASTLAFVAAVAAEEAVGLFLPPGLRHRLSLKWPNDLLIAGAKLAGILLERSGDDVVVGLGVNLARGPDLPDRATTSLADQGASVAPAVFAETMAEVFARWLVRWRQEGFAPVRRRWLERAHPIGVALTSRSPDGSALDGLFDGLDADGALILRLAGGDRHVIHAGDVFLL